MLSQQHRRTIHQKLAPIVGEEEVDAMLSEFPASASDAPATRADLAATRADLESTITEVRVALESSIAEVRIEMHDLGRQMIMWSTGSVIAGMGLAATIASLFGG